MEKTDVMVKMAVTELMANQLRLLQKKMQMEVIQLLLQIQMEQPKN